MERRYGRMVIDRHIMEANMDFMKKLMSVIIVLRCEMLYCRDAFEYFFYSDLIPPLSKGQEVPEYTAIYDNNQGVRFERSGNY